MAKFFSFFSRKDQGSASQDVIEERNKAVSELQNPDSDEPAPQGISSRLVETPIGWFARTREKDDLGPYPSDQDAIDALSAYLNFTRPNDVRRYSPEIIHGMVIHDPETCRKDLCAFCIEAEASQQGTWDDLIEN